MRKTESNKAERPGKTDPEALESATAPMNPSTSNGANDGDWPTDEEVAARRAEILGQQLFGLREMLDVEKDPAWRKLICRRVDHLWMVFTRVKQATAARNALIYVIENASTEDNAATIRRKLAQAFPQEAAQLPEALLEESLRVRRTGRGAGCSKWEAYHRLCKKARLLYLCAGPEELRQAYKNSRNALMRSGGNTAEYHGSD
jgi:hypothetical protein